MVAVDKILKILTLSGLAQFLVDKAQQTRQLLDSIPRTLVLSMDEASTGFAAAQFLMYAVGMRFLMIRDPLHREWNDAKLAVGEAGLWWVVLLTRVVFNLPHGPWAGRRFWKTLKAHAREMLATASAHGPLFSHFYEDLCKDQGTSPQGGSSQRDRL